MTTTKAQTAQDLLIQIDDLVRIATPEEVAAIKARQAEIELEATALKEKAIAKAALLERLGLTADEAAILLG